MRNYPDLALLNGRVLIASALTLTLALATPVFAHGVGGETLAPITIGDRNATLSISMKPVLYDAGNLESELKIRLYDADSQSEFKNVSFLIAMSKDGSRFFRYMFHDDLGDLVVNLIHKDSERISVFGNRHEAFDGWMMDGDDPVRIEGPVLPSGGLYEFEIKIVSVDSYMNVLDRPLIFNSAISIGDKFSYQVSDAIGDRHRINVTSWYDTIDEFSYSAEKKNMLIALPFDWGEETIDQIQTVHQEIRVPVNFHEFISNTYNVGVNGIELPDSAIIVDDYSDQANKILHIVVPQETLREIRRDAELFCAENLILSIDTATDSPRTFVRPATCPRADTWFSFLRTLGFR